MIVYLKNRKRILNLIGCIFVVFFIGVWAFAEFQKAENWIYLLIFLMISFHIFRRYIAVMNSHQFIQIEFDRIIIPAKTVFSTNGYVTIERDKLDKIIKLNFPYLSGYLIKKGFFPYFIYKNDFKTDDFHNIESLLKDYGYVE